MVKTIKKIIILLMSFSLLLTPIFTSAVAEKAIYNPPKNLKIEKFDEGYTNLTVHETWELIQTEDNGIHYLIDVRTQEEYKNERISTPFLLEKPRLHPLQ